MNKPTCKEILKGIRTKNNKVLQLIYAENYPLIKSYIQRKNGNSHDAEDILQESLILIFKKVSTNGITLESSFSTYLFSVCRFLWLRELEKRKLEFSDELEQDLIEKIDIDLIDDPDKFEKQSLIQKCLLKLDPECRMLLMMYYDNAPMEDISENLGFSNNARTRKKKFNCKKKLIELIKSDPLYKEIMDS